MRRPLPGFANFFQDHPPPLPLVLPSPNSIIPPLPQRLWSLTLGGNTHSIIPGFIFHLNTCTVPLPQGDAYMIYPPTYSFAISEAGTYGLSVSAPRGHTLLLNHGRVKLWCLQHDVVVRWRSYPVIWLRGKAAVSSISIQTHARGRSEEGKHWL